MQVFFVIDAPIPGQEPAFTITDTKLYVPVVTLPSQDNANLLQQLKSGLKRAINWNRYQPKVTVQEQNRYLDFLIDPTFQGVIKLFALSFENSGGRISYTRYYLPLVETREYNVMIDGRNVFDQRVKNNLITYNNIRKIVTGQGDDYTAGCLLNYPYFKNYVKMIALDLSKQQALDADPKEIHQINFTANPDQAGNTTMFFIIEKAKETILDVSQGTVKVL